MGVREDDLWQLKSGMAALAVCFVRTLEKSDPTFQERFLENLAAAYRHFRDDADRKEVEQTLELLSWTRELLTGWSNVSGQGQPFIKN